jgi:hypothetical protein
MQKEKIVAMLLIGFAVLGILYYLGKKKTLPAAGGSGPATSAGGGTISRNVSSAAGGVSGSIPNIIAAAAALTGKSVGDVFVRNAQNTTLIPPGSEFSTTTAPDVNVLVAPTIDPIDLSGVTLPGIAASGADVAGAVSALDAGGLDYGTLYA